MTTRANTLDRAKSIDSGMPLRPVASCAFTILGVCYSLKNSKMLTTRGGLRPIKNAKARKFEDDFSVQVPVSCRNLGLGGPLRSSVTVWYPNLRQDLDCAIVYDLLQKCGVVKNDRQFIEKHEYRAVDARQPRVEIVIEEI